MARVTKRVLEGIRSRSDIAEVVGAYVTLKHTGSTFKALCPFHKEKTPSFTVNPQLQIFHCFGCGAGGDVFRFIMQHENMDFMGAVRMLAEKAGVKLEMDEEEGEGAGVDKNRLYRIHLEVAQFFQRCLLDSPAGSRARDYLKSRELEASVVKDFMIGYAPARWDAVVEWAAHHKQPLELLDAGGLILKKDNDRGYYDRFRNRIMFPIRDEQGRVIGFSGRLYEDDGEKAGGKYVNSPETPLFKKSRVLYALDRARKAILESREAIICEGQIDVIRCHQAGFATAVAAQGTAFTEEHTRILRRYADSVVLMFDSDTAGQTAAVRAAGAFLEAGLAVRVASLPTGEDPDSFIRKEGAEAFGAIVEGAVSVIRFQVAVLAARENLKSDAGLMRASRALLETIQRSANAVQQSRMVEEAAELLRIPPESLQRELSRSQRKKQWVAATAAKEIEEPPAGGEDAAAEAPRERPPEEAALCAHLVHFDEHPELVVRVQHYLPLELVTDPLCRTLVRGVLEAAKNGWDLQDALRDPGDESGEAQRYAAQLVAEPVKVKGGEVSHDVALKDCIREIWKRHLTRERAELTSADAERRSELTYALKALSSWDKAVVLIETEIATRQRNEGDPLSAEPKSLPG